MGVLAFWAAALLTGALALPLAFMLLRRLPDAGAGLSFALGLVLAGYAYFILRTLSVLPYGRGGYLLVLALLGLVSAGVAGRDRRFLSTLRRVTPALVVVAGIFTVAFFGYTAFRSYQPDITGTEQPMDLMYLNATLESPDYPPRDPWLAGERASYYYFGYLQAGVLTSVAGVPASTGYNLSLAYTFAAAATAVASLAYAMARWALGSRARNWAYWAGGVAVVMLLGVASLGAVFEWFAAHGHTNAAVFDFFGITWRISCAEQLRDFCYDGPAQRTNAWYPTEFWWWFGLTRTIPGTITEFPFFSFLLGDLHPHVMSIPLVLLVLALAANAWRGRSELSWRTHLRHPLEGLLIALVLGALAFENAWDLLTFTAVFSVAVVVHDLRRGRPLFTLHDAFGYLGPLFAVAVVAYVPWYAEFTSQASGLYPYVGEGTKPAHAFLQFGPLLLAGLVGLTFTLRARDRQVIATTGVTALWVPLLPLMAWLLYATQQGDLRDAVDARSGGGWVTLGAYGVSTWLFAVAFGVNALKRRAIALPLGLAATGALLFYGAELFYVGDIFKDSVPRLNTVFKLTYQAWILLSAAGAVLLVLAAREALRNRRALAWLWAPVAAAVALGLVYALIALPNRTDGFDKETATDGLAFVARNDPPEYALTRWVQDHTGPGDVIIEASGRTWRRGEDGQPVVVNDGVDYTDAGRISARTGRATAIGWFFHEVQWRGQGEANRAELTRRQDLLDSVYTASSPQVALNAMDRVGARYVVVGRVELSRFPGDLMPKFETFLDVVFESDGLRVYEKPSYTVTHTS